MNEKVVKKISLITSLLGVLLLLGLTELQKSPELKIDKITKDFVDKTITVKE